MSENKQVPAVPPRGVWCPAVTLFDPARDEIDFREQAKYFSYLRGTGLTGLVVLGTNAETFLLTREERRELVKCARSVCGEEFPLMVGVGGHSTRQVGEFIEDAGAEGANYILVLPPAYFGAKATTPAVIDSFFTDVAELAAEQGMGTVIYNFPGVCNGVDLDSATIARLAGGPNEGRVVGVKLTCGSVAKITRLAAQLPADRFSVFGGQSDFLIGGLAVGSAGCIAAFANVFPRTIVKVYKLWHEGKTTEALVLHRKAALAEQAVKAGGVAAVKYAASLFTGPRAGIEGAEELMRPRKPYLPLSDEAKRAIREAMAEVAEIERSLD
ncbi:hypothetical protein QBC47DRAFT_380913 [Echria macrotheca]|uniref:Dihydrodipicolinate synthetase n=1 Tax=Echria macrotheca TaxID=438768 RepID=A0AAJ0F9S1_9PEZI|nr:hypothetical protein QBC47DRAFT_380913 [Echria macrotheca]